MTLFKGAATALLTPFTSDGKKVDFEALARSIHWQIKQGIDALVIAGTTGETSSLTEEEHKAIIRFTVDTVAKRVPVIAGTGSNNTDDTIAMTQYAEMAGADAVLIVNPYYNRTTQKGLVTHYTAIHDATTIPIILYNVPSRTSMNMDPQTVLTLSMLPRIIAIKEASNNFSQITELARFISDEFILYSGNDDTVIPLLALGGSGVISVASNIIPGVMHTLATDFLEGRHGSALNLQLNYKPLIDALFLETNPSPVKYATRYLERDLGPLRLPMVAIEEQTAHKLIRELESVNLNKGWT
jgi:4-hydroxy-tetrahydrodipicolinate synthase